MNVYSYLCFLSALSILIGFFTRKVSDRIQYTIAVTATSMVCSLGLIFLGSLGWFQLDSIAKSIMKAIDFKTFLIDGVLGFLLFAGALGIRLPVLKSQSREISSLALFSTFASTFFIGFLIYGVAALFGWDVPLVYCLLFGALISPTDPIAVLAIIKNLKAPQKLSMKVEGESLFNDGVGLVIFTTIFAVAFGGQAPTFDGIMGLFLKEAVGGILFGLVLGFAVHYLVASTSDPSLETLLTLMIPTAGYVFAGMLHVSGPLSMVVAGIIIGNWTMRDGFSQANKENFNHFWEMIDHFLNSLLFLLIGFAMLLVDFTTPGILLTLFAIPICLLCRYVSVWIPFKVLGRNTVYNPYTLKILTWGGLRGGLSLAMALSIPSGVIKIDAVGMDIHDLLVVMTYGVVLFAILVQGTTVETMIRKSKDVIMAERGYVGIKGKTKRVN